MRRCLPVLAVAIVLLGWALSHYLAGGEPPAAEQPAGELMMLTAEDTADNDPGASAAQGWCSDDGEEAPAFPRTLDDLVLCEYQGGNDALLIVQQALGIEELFETSHILSYSGNRRQAFFWLARLSSAAEAEKLVSSMDRRIADSERFDYYSVQEIGGHEVFYVQGSKIDNFFYHKEQTVYWVMLNGVQDPAEFMRRIFDDI